MLYRRLLGGLGKPLEADRDYTEIEIGLLEHLVKGIVNPMKTVWRDYLEIAPRLMKIETNARILQGIGADENVVIIVMNILVNETQGKMNICIPAVTLDAMFKLKNAQSKRRGGETSCRTPRGGRISCGRSANRTWR